MAEGDVPLQAHFNKEEEEEEEGMMEEEERESWRSDGFIITSQKLQNFKSA